MNTNAMPGDQNLIRAANWAFQSVILDGLTDKPVFRLDGLSCPSIEIRLRRYRTLAETELPSAISIRRLS